jgi:hypothetical protein
VRCACLYTEVHIGGREPKRTASWCAERLEEQWDGSDEDDGDDDNGDDGKEDYAAGGEVSGDAPCSRLDSALSSTVRIAARSSLHWTCTV